MALSAIRARAKALRGRAALERDLRAFRRRYGDVLAPTPAPTRGKALLASLTYSPFQLKLEGMIAKAFQLRGLEVVAAVPAGSDLPRRYLEVFGVRQFTTLEQFLGEDGKERARREAERLLETARSMSPIPSRGGCSQRFSRWPCGRLWPRTRCSVTSSPSSCSSTSATTQPRARSRISRSNVG